MFSRLAKISFAALFLSVGFLIGMSVQPSAAQSNVYDLDTKAKQMILVDFKTGTVLSGKNQDEKMYPSSMTKLMTAYLAFEQLKNGTLSLDDTFSVSKKAWETGGSKMFVRVATTAVFENCAPRVEHGAAPRADDRSKVVVRSRLSGSCAKSDGWASSCTPSSGSRSLGGGPSSRSEMAARWHRDAT